MANEVFVGVHPAAEAGRRKATRLVAMVPLNAKGLKILSRKSYEAHAPSVFDNPLSSRFDENDAVLYFDDVKVPWERVFVAQRHRDVPGAVPRDSGARLPELPGQIRLMVKLRFLLGLAQRIADTNGITNFPQVRETLGQLAAETAMVEGMVIAMEATGSQHGKYFVPEQHAALCGAGADPAALSEVRQRRCASWPAAA